MTASLASLLSDIERATEGSLALDCQIEVAHGLPDFQLPTLNAGWEWALEADEYRVSLIIRGPKFSKVYKQYNPPLYTRSLDAAMTLIGKVDGSQLSVRLSAWDGGKLGAHAWLFALSDRYMSDVKCWGEAHIGWPGCKTIERAHSLFPLALCAACLRARMATTQNEKPPNPHEGSPAA